MKVFGSYGKFFDIMKLNVAIIRSAASTGTIALRAGYVGPDTIVPALEQLADRYCVGPPTDTATGHFGRAGQHRPVDLHREHQQPYLPDDLLECSPTSTGVTPGLKPYSQHESVFGVDYH